MQTTRIKRGYHAAISLFPRLWMVIKMSDQHNFTDQERQMSVRDMGLSRKTMLSLLRNDIETLQDLLDVIDVNGLKDLYTMGSVRIKEVNNKIAEMQTAKYHDFKAQLAITEQRKKDINKQIAKYKAAILKLENEAKYNDEIINNLHKNYKQAEGKEL